MSLNAAANAITDCRKRGGTIYTIGNGGSAATASHMMVDLGKGANEKPDESGNFFHVECLADNIPTMTAISNDLSYDDIFIFQLERKLKSGDLLIAISGSGNSRNIVKAAEFAKSIGVPIVGMTGYEGGKLDKLCDFRMHCRIDYMKITENIHMMIDHILMRGILPLRVMVNPSCFCRARGIFLCAISQYFKQLWSNKTMTKAEFEARKRWNESIMTEDEIKAHWERIHSFCGKIDDEIFIIYNDPIPVMAEVF